MQCRSHGKHGDPIGAITLDTEAPREFTDAEAEFLVASASLVAGAIENARLYDETRQRVSELEQLTELAEAVAAARRSTSWGPRSRDGRASCSAPRRVRLYLLDTEGDRLLCRFAEPSGTDEPTAIGLTELGPEVGRGSRAARVTVSLVAGDELLGAIVAEGTRELDLARTVANQAAVAIKKIEVLERLTEKDLIKDFFEELAEHPASDGIESRARRWAATSTRRISFSPRSAWTTRSSGASCSLASDAHRLLRRVAVELSWSRPLACSD